MNTVIFEFGMVSVTWYSFLIFLGIIIGIFLVKKEADRINFDSSFLIDLCFYIIPIGIIGARIYYVMFNFDIFKNNLLSIFKIWEGGIAIYGAIISAVFFIIYYCKKKNKPILQTLDILAPCVILAQGIGRWGNFVNKEAYGIIVEKSFLEKLHIPNFIIEGVYIDGNYHHPTFLYESLWCIIGFIILLLIRYFYKKNKVSFITSIYFIWYGIGRIFIESLRTDSLYLGVFRISQIVSLIFIIIGIVLLIKNKHNECYYKEKKV